MPNSIYGTCVICVPFLEQ